MEQVNLATILDTVKSIISNTPLIAHDQTTGILPSHIPALPTHSTQLTESALPLSRVLEGLSRDVLPYLNKASLSANYYGFVTGGVTPAAQLADILTSVFDQNVSVHLPDDTIATRVEVAALNMLLALFQLPPSDWAIGTGGNGGGTITTGATASNILGLALGREFVLNQKAKRKGGKLVSVAKHGLLAASQAVGVNEIKVLSTLPHSSIAKACSIVGLGRDSLVSVAREGHHLDIDLDRIEQLAQVADEEGIAYIVAISAGEVNTGHFASDSSSQMHRLRQICDRYGLWLHVDGAFGLFARVLLGHQPQSDEFTAITGGVQGLELADSITADGHKLLNVPYDCGIFFTRHKQLSFDTCQNGGAAYLASTSDDDIQSPLNIGLENSRRWRAFPVYTTLLAYGREGYCDMLIRQITLARRVAAFIQEHDKFDLLPVDQNGKGFDKIFMIVLFKQKDRDANRSLVQRINATGKIYVSGTAWAGSKAARIAISNWKCNVDRDLEIIKAVLNEV